MKKKLYEVSDVELINSELPRKSKSGGTLTVHMQMPLQDLLKHLVSLEELGQTPDIRGIRNYTVRDIPKDHVAGNHFHKLKVELMYVLDGFVEFECSDLFGKSRKIERHKDQGLIVFPSIMHSIRALEANSGISVFATTLYRLEDPNTHDTYGTEEFEELKRRLFCN